MEIHLSHCSVSGNSKFFLSYMVLANRNDWTLERPNRCGGINYYRGKRPIHLLMKKTASTHKGEDPRIELTVCVRTRNPTLCSNWIQYLYQPSYTLIGTLVQERKKKEEEEAGINRSIQLVKACKNNYQLGV